MEDRFDLRLQPARHHRLGDPVRDSRDPEQPDPAIMWLRYLHRPHRGRKIAARGHPIPYPIPSLVEDRRRPWEKPGG